MITDRNKLNFVTIQWLLWFFSLILLCSGSGNGSGNSNALIHNVESTQQQLQQQQQQQQQQQHQTLPQSSAPQQQPQTKQQQQQQHIESNGPPQQDVTVRNFSPRMDYNNNEWRPVGRGDPLKNDPTFDYSPPTLDRVRYWADPDKEKEKMDDVSAAVLDAKLKKANPGKNEILLLGVTGDRMRGAPVLQHAHTPTSVMLKNAKGETPLLQPKYTSIRRSYYAHQLPTHLMPPPMQPMMPSSQQQQPQQQQQQQNTVHMIKPAHTEYRHNMPAGMSGHSYMSSPLMATAMNAHSKPYHMSSTTQAWLHSPSASASMATSKPSHHMKPMAMSPQHYSHHPQDAHHQESVHYMTYTRPSMMSSTPAVMSGHHEYYSPNSIRGGAGVMHKAPTSSRKPWLHDLLKKEIIKPQKPTMSPNYYHTEAPKPPQMETHFEPMLAPKGISTTYAPVTFVTPTTTPATTPAAIYVTSSSTTYHTTTAPIYTQAPTTPHTTTRTTTTLSPTRLLIPNTSNLAYRPTVTPMKMTTDSLFSHYNQPEKPLKGPMYLIIEGHSKVKTYGKDELDPHRPKIVPVISKREPVVRRGDPNEKRGTPETFQVKHLHTKTTQPMEKPTATTPIPKAATTTKKPVVTSTVNPNIANKTTAKTTKATKPTATTKPTASPKPPAPTKPAASPKTTPAVKKAQPAAVATTVKPISTTKPVPKLQAGTSSTTTATTAKHKIEKIPPKEEKNPPKDSKSPMKGEKLSPNNLNALDTPAKPSQVILNQPPTGMQGLLSLLGSSLDSLLRDDANNAPAADGTTKLQPVNMNSQPQIESRVSTKLQAIKAEDYYDDDDFNDQLMQATTEYLPRETRQIFDYDQMPESRITEDKDATNYQDIIDNIDDEEDLSALGLDDEYEDEEADDEEEEPSPNHQLIKRIDALVSSAEDLDEGFDDDDDDDMEALDLARQRNRSTKKA